MRYVLDDNKTIATHSVTSSTSSIISAFPLIRHVHKNQLRLFLLNTSTRVSLHRLYRFRRHTQHDSGRKLQLNAPISHSVLNRIRCSDPQYASIFSAHPPHAISELCHNTMQNAYPMGIYFKCLDSPRHKPLLQLFLQSRTLHCSINDS